jgi:hypothetical protein
MAVHESKLKTGKLLLGTAPGVEYACQQTNVRIVPEFNEEGDAVETLCGDTLTPSTTTAWSLQGTAIQDWDSTTGISFIKYSWQNNGVTVPFSWQPNAGATTITGNVTVRALELGGDVNTRITSDFTWPLAGDPTPVWPTAAVPATGATAGTPGVWTPASSTPPTSVANLISGTPTSITATPATAWTAGQYVQTGTAGLPGQAHWDGTAWVAAPALLEADEADTGSGSSGAGTAAYSVP